MSVEHVDTTKSLDWNINELYINDVDPNEIAEILAMAKDLVAQEYTWKYNGWEMSTKRDEKTGQIISKVDMPEFPGLDQVLATAEKMYTFVNAATPKNR